MNDQIGKFRDMGGGGGVSDRWIIDPVTSDIQQVSSLFLGHDTFLCQDTYICRVIIIQDVPSAHLHLFSFAIR
jgi:hypothetical protein